jgi:hypothetical protein
MNFKDHAVITIDGITSQCSDYYKWHSQMYLKRVNENDPNNLDLTRDAQGLQKLGGGWITIPANP